MWKIKIHILFCIKLGPSIDCKYPETVLKSEELDLKDQGYTPPFHTALTTHFRESHFEARLLKMYMIHSGTSLPHAYVN